MVQNFMKNLSEIFWSNTVVHIMTRKTVSSAIWEPILVDAALCRSESDIFPHSKHGFPHDLVKKFVICLTVSWQTKYKWKKSNMKKQYEWKMGDTVSQIVMVLETMKITCNLLQEQVNSGLNIRNNQCCKNLNISWQD